MQAAAKRLIRSTRCDTQSAHHDRTASSRSRRFRNPLSAAIRWRDSTPPPLTRLQNSRSGQSNPESSGHPQALHLRRCSWGRNNRRPDDPEDTVMNRASHSGADNRRTPTEQSQQHPKRRHCRSHTGEDTPTDWRSAQLRVKLDTYSYIVGHTSQKVKTHIDDANQKELKR